MSCSTPEIDVEQLARASAAGATVIDVREASEYVAGHVPDATPIPMAQLASRIDELDESRPVYVLCATGGRSAAMTDLLVAAGLNAYSVAGGTVAWSHSGRALETGAPRKN